MTKAFHVHARIVLSIHAIRRRRRRRRRGKRAEGSSAGLNRALGPSYRRRVRPIGCLAILDLSVEQFQ